MAFDAGSIDAQLRLDRSPFRQGLAMATREARQFARQTFQASLDVNTVNYSRKMLKAEQTADRLDGKTVTIDVDADTAGAEGKLRALDSSTRSAGGGANLLQTALMAIGPAAIPTLAAATAGVGALGGALTAAGGATAVFGLGVVSVLKPAIANYTALKKAQKEYDNATTKAGKNTALKKQQKILSQMDDQQAGLVDDIQRLASAFTHFGDAIKPQVFSIAHTGINTVIGVMKELKPILPPITNEFKFLTDRISVAATGPGAKRFIAFIGKEGPLAIDAFATVIGNVVGTIGNLIYAFNPLTQRILPALMHGSQVMKDWSAGLSVSPGFQKFMAYVNANGPKLFQTIGLILQAVGQITVALAPIGPVALNLIAMLAQFVGQTAKAHPGLIQLAYVLILAYKGFNLMNGAVRSAISFGKNIAGAYTGARTAITAIGGAARRAATGFASMAASAGRAVAAGARATASGAAAAGRGVAAGSVAAYQGASRGLAAMATAARGAALWVGRTTVALASQGLTLAKNAGLWAINTARLVAARVAQLAVRGATMAWAAVQWILNAALNANPIGIIVIAIAALVAGIIYAYNHSKTFRTIVQGALRAVGNAALWVWRNAILPLWNGIKAAWNGIVAATRWVSKIVTSVWRTLWGWIRSFVNTELKGARIIVNAVFRGFQAAFQWINRVVGAIWRTLWGWIRSFVNTELRGARILINAAFQGFRAAFNWVKNVVSAVWRTLWHWISSFVGTTLRGARALINGAFNGFRAAFNWVRNVVSNVWHSMWSGVHNTAVSWLGKIRNFINRAVQGFRDAFNWGKNQIGKVWNGIKAITAKPVNFVINTVYNKGIAWFFNKVASFLHIGARLKALSTIPGYARGGILPGQSSWRSGDDQLVPMRRGEGVYVSEAMRNPYERARLHAVNAAATSGASLARFQGPNDAAMGGFALGGIFEDAWNVASSIGRSISSVAGKAWGGIRDIGSWIYDHTIKQLWTKLGGGRVNAQIATLVNQAGGWGSTIAQVPKTILSQVMTYLQKALDSMGGGSGGAVVQAAKSQLGVPYSWGGGTKSGPSYGIAQGAHIRGFDCSGLMEYAYWKGAHYNLPGTDATQIRHGRSVHNRRSLQPGDIMRPHVGHIYMAVTPGAEGPHGIIEAPRTGLNVRLTSFRGMAAGAKHILSGPRGGGGSTAGGRHASPSAAKSYAYGAMREFGWSPSYNWPSLDTLWNHESNWRWWAANPSGAYGIPQALPGSKMRSAGADWHDNAYTQVKWGLGYISGRYHNPVGAWSFWRRHHWYDDGGDLLPGATVAWNGTGKVESTVTAEWRDKIETRLDELASRRDQPLVGSYTTVYQDVGQTRKAMQELEHRLRSWNQQGGI